MPKSSIKFDRDVSFDKIELRVCNKIDHRRERSISLLSNELFLVGP